MTAPEDTYLDRDVAFQIAELTCEILLSRSLYEPEELAVRDTCGPIIAAYRVGQCVGAKERTLQEFAKLAVALREEADSVHRTDETKLIIDNILLSAIKVEGTVARLRGQP